jgi:hypothetical protein
MEPARTQVRSVPLSSLWMGTIFVHVLMLCCARQCPKSTAVDRRVFQGIVDLDDEGSTDFSTQMVHTYLAVATSTLSDMDRAVCVMPFFPLPHIPYSSTSKVRRNQRNPGGQTVLPTRPRIENAEGFHSPPPLPPPFPSFFFFLFFFFFS